MKKTLIAALLATLVASPAAYAEKIGVTIANSNPWLTLVRNGMQAKVKTMKGVDAQFEDAQDDIGRQLNHIQNFIAQKVDAIVVVTVDSQATPKMTKMATDGKRLSIGVIAGWSAMRYRSAGGFRRSAASTGAV